MAERAKSTWQLIKQTFVEFGADDCASMAAALAYYTIFSLPPLLVIIISVAGIFWSPEDLQGTVESQIESMVGESGKEQIHSMMAQAGEQKGGTLGMIIGVVILLVGATGLVGQLQHALNKTWEVEPDPKQGGIMTFMFKRVLSLGMILAVAFLLLVSLVLTAILSSAGDLVGSLLPEGVSEIWPMVIEFGISFIIIWLLFTSIFKFLPDAKIAWSDVWVGGAITTLLFMLGKHLMGLYLGSQASGAGPVILLLLWIYYSSIILLLGAEFTQIWARSYGKDIEPEPGAVRVERDKAYQRPGQASTGAAASAKTANPSTRFFSNAQSGLTPQAAVVTNASISPVLKQHPVDVRKPFQLPVLALLVVGGLLLKSRVQSDQRP